MKSYVELGKRIVHEGWGPRGVDEPSQLAREQSLLCVLTYIAKQLSEFHDPEAIAKRQREAIKQKLREANNHQSNVLDSAIDRFISSQIKKRGKLYSGSRSALSWSLYSQYSPYRYGPVRQKYVFKLPETVGVNEGTKLKTEYEKWLKS